MAQPLPREGRRRPRPARRGVRAHPRQQVRRARDRRLARHPRRLPRRDGIAQDARQAHRAAARGRRHRRRSSPASTRRSASTSVPAPRRRPRCRSAPRSSAPAPGGQAHGAARRHAGRSTRELRHRGPPGRGRGRVERARLRHRARRWPRKASRSRSAAGRRSGSTPPRRRSVRWRCRWSPTSPPRRARPASCRTARDALGGVDILVCNGGGPPPATSRPRPRRPTGPRSSSTACAHIAMCNEAVPAMREQRWGRVVAITSVGVRQPIARVDPLERRPFRPHRLPQDARP